MSGSLIRATPPCARMSAGHALERHDGHRAGVLGDLRLLRRDDVHDHAALEHLGHAALDAGGARRWGSRRGGRASWTRGHLTGARTAYDLPCYGVQGRAPAQRTGVGSASSISKEAGSAARPARRSQRTRRCWRTLRTAPTASLWKRRRARPAGSAELQLHQQLGAGRVGGQLLGHTPGPRGSPAAHGSGRSRGSPARRFGLPRVVAGHADSSKEGRGRGAPSRRAAAVAEALRCSGESSAARAPWRPPCSRSSRAAVKARYQAASATDEPQQQVRLTAKLSGSESSVPPGAAIGREQQPVRCRLAFLARLGGGPAVTVS